MADLGNALAGGLLTGLTSALNTQSQLDAFARQREMEAQINLPKFQNVPLFDKDKNILGFQAMPIQYPGAPTGAVQPPQNVNTLGSVSQPGVLPPGTSTFSPNVAWNTTAKGGVSMRSTSPAKAWGTTTTLTPKNIDYSVEQLGTGGMSPSEWKKTSYYRATNPLDVFEKVHEVYPWYKPSEADTAYAFQNKTQTQRFLTNVESVIPIMHDLAKESADAKRPGFTAISDLYQKGTLEVGSPEFVQFRTLMTHLAPEFASILSGGQAMTDDQLKVAQNMFEAKMNDKQVQQALKTLGHIIDAKYKATYDRTLAGYIARKGKPVREDQGQKAESAEAILKKYGIVP